MSHAQATTHRIGRLVGTLSLSVLAALPAIAQASVNVEPSVTPGRFDYFIPTPNGTVVRVSDRPISPPLDNSFRPGRFSKTAKGNIMTPTGLVLSADGKKVVTPHGTISSDRRFTLQPDGTIKAMSGALITPYGLVISPDKRKVTTPFGTVTSNQRFTLQANGSITAPDGTIVTPYGTIVSPDGQVVSPRSQQ